MSRFWQLILTVVAAVSASVLTCGSALAVVAPPDPAGVPGPAGPSPIVIERVVESGSSSMWSVVIVAVLAAAATAFVVTTIAAMAQRRQSRRHVAVAT